MSEDGYSMGYTDGCRITERIVEDRIREAVENLPHAEDHPAPTVLLGAVLALIDGEDSDE